MSVRKLSTKNTEGIGQADVAELASDPTEKVTTTAMTRL